MGELPQLNYQKKINLFKKLYPGLFHYKSVSNILWQESLFEGLYTTFRIKDITMLIDYEDSIYGSKKHHKVIVWDRVSYLLLYLVLSSIEEFGLNKNNCTIVPNAYIIDSKVGYVDTYDAVSAFSPTLLKKYPTEATVNNMFKDIIAAKSKKITLVYLNHADLERSAYYIPIFEPRDENYEDELIERLGETAYKG
jgi:hypothetical protein